MKKKHGNTGKKNRLGKTGATRSETAKQLPIRDYPGIYDMYKEKAAEAGYTSTGAFLRDTLANALGVDRDEYEQGIRLK